MESILLNARISPQAAATFQSSLVVSNTKLCRDHYRLSLQVRHMMGASPGQFVHLNPPLQALDDYSSIEWAPGNITAQWQAQYAQPMLRRAFSIAGQRPIKGTPAYSEIDVIYRVVGAATTWMYSLQRGDEVSVLGPLGNEFPIDSARPHAWLVAGGVGLPPLLYLAEELNRRAKHTVALFGAQSADLVPLTIRNRGDLAPDGRRPSDTVQEFALYNAGAIISTDDGSLGFHGHVGDALRTFHKASGVGASDVTVYTCGPEVMMGFVARYCAEHAIQCYACMERAMACGTGTCQSCVVEIKDPAAVDGWRYDLCCTKGPVFDARHVVWE